MPLYKDRDGFIRRTPDEPQGWITKGFTRWWSMHKLSPPSGYRRGLDTQRYARLVGWRRGSILLGKAD